MGYPLYVNIDSGSVANSLVRGSGSQASGTASPPEIVLGDKRELDFYFVDASGAYADFSGDNTYSLAIAISFPGGIKSRPSGGDFTLTFDGDTTSPLPYNISASDLEDELNGLASVISAGLLDVTGPDGGPFIITFRTTGDQGTFSADASNLEPRSQVYATTTVEGDGSTQETVVLQLRRTVAAYQNSFTVITDDESNPIGWSGELNASTEGLVELLAGNDTVNAFFEIQVTDPSGNPRTYGQYKCTIRNQIIDPGTVSGPVLEVLLTQSEADARYLQIANNLSDLDSPSDARTNLGLGSAATQDTGSSDGDVLQGDGTITNANASQIIEIDGDGKVKSSGKSFGATIDDLFKGRSSNRITSINELMFQFGSFKQTVFNRASCTDEFTGSGGVNFSTDNTAVYSTGTTPGSLARIRNTQIRDGLSIGGNIFYLPKNRPHFLRWFVAPGTEYGADGFIYCTFGKPSSSAAGPIDNTEYVGFRISGASRSLSIVHNSGTGSQTVISTGVNLSNDVMNSLVLYCDGAGATCNYRAYRNGVFVGSFSHVSGSTIFSGPSRIMTEVYNGTDATDRSFCYLPSEIFVQGPS